MEIYLFCIFLSICSFNISVKCRWTKLAYFFLTISVLLPSLLSGFRDDTIGRDLQLYGINCWDISCGMRKLQEVFIYSLSVNTEIGYVLLNYLISRVTHDIHIFLFIHQLIIASTFYIVAYRLRKNASYPNFIVVFYLLMVFVQSFNLLRQSMAIAFVFLAYYLFFICKNKYWSLAIALLAMSFHNSIVLVSLLPVLYYYIKNGGNKSIYIIAIIVTLFVFVFFKMFVVNLISNGILSSKYEHYATQIGYKSHKSNIVFSVISFVLLLRNKDKYKLMNKINYTFVLASIFISICMLLLGDVTEVANRVAIYYSIPSFYIFWQLDMPIKTAKRIYYVLTLAMLAVWLYAASIGFSECVPYTSKILGI